MSLSTGAQAEWERLSASSGSGWWRLNRGGIPSFVPATMRDKLDGGIMILSASSSGSTLAVFSAERIDKGNLDIQPFGLFVRSSGADATMALVHHGGWLDRTTPLPGDFWSIASTCSTGSYFFAKPPEGKVSGSLDELTAPHRDAYGRIVDYYSSESSAT